MIIAVAQTTLYFHSTANTWFSRSKRICFYTTREGGSIYNSVRKNLSEKPCKNLLPTFDNMFDNILEGKILTFCKPDGAFDVKNRLNTYIKFSYMAKKILLRKKTILAYFLSQFNNKGAIVSELLKYTLDIENLSCFWGSSMSIKSQRRN